MVFQCVLQGVMLPTDVALKVIDGGTGACNIFPAGQDKVLHVVCGQRLFRIFFLRSLRHLTIGNRLCTFHIRPFCRLLPVRLLFNLMKILPGFLPCRKSAHRPVAVTVIFLPYAVPYSKILPRSKGIARFRDGKPLVRFRFAFPRRLLRMGKQFLHVFGRFSAFQPFPDCGCVNVGKVTATRSSVFGLLDMMSGSFHLLRKLLFMLDVPSCLVDKSVQHRRVGIHDHVPVLPHGIWLDLLCPCLVFLRDAHILPLVCDGIGKHIAYTLNAVFLYHALCRVLREPPAVKFLGNRPLDGTLAGNLRFALQLFLLPAHGFLGLLFFVLRIGFLPFRG